MSGQGKTQRGALSLLLLGPFLLAVLVPFLWMVLGIFKTNNEFFQPLGKAFFPVNYAVSYTHLTLPTIYSV